MCKVEMQKRVIIATSFKTCRNRARKGEIWRLFLRPFSFGYNYSISLYFKMTVSEKLCSILYCMSFKEKRIVITVPGSRDTLSSGLGSGTGKFDLILDLTVSSAWWRNWFNLTSESGLWLWLDLWLFQISDHSWLRHVELGLRNVSCP